MPFTTRLAAVGGAATLAVLAAAGPASAHVTADPSNAEQGSYTKVTFRVPNEEASATTTQVQVDLPLDHPIASVAVRPVPGWTVAVAKTKLAKPLTSDDGTITQAVSKIVWTRGTIEPGQFQEFEVSMGPLPTDTDTLTFTAVQTYSDGQVVNWNQPTPADGKEPDHPAPAVHLTAPAPKTLAGNSTIIPAEDGTARLLGGLGLAVGAVGIVVGAYGLMRGRSRA